MKQPQESNPVAPSTGAIDYSSVGVNVDREENALSGLHRWLDKTLHFRDGLTGSPAMGIGFFANILNLGNGMGLAISTDGVGTKILVARMMNKYDTVGIDCIAMNVNDIICVGAEPIALVDYLGIQEANAELVEQISKGLHDGAKTARISIPGGELAQIPEMLTDELPGVAFDLVGTAIGSVHLDRVINGRGIADHDLIIGLRSSGIHSNGLTLARRALFEMGGFGVDTFRDELGRTVGEELLEPTVIYVPPIMEMLNSEIEVKALAHITGDGLMNLTRVESQVGFVIDNLPEPQPIFSLIQRCGTIQDEEMFRVFNMGIGFCIVVPERDADRVLNIAGKHGNQGYVIGHTVAGSEKTVSLTQNGLIGKGRKFFKG
ncbi:MAG: phosphoribosylformylglycinamidine cyclo-ligase [Chloroflexota bacterium]|nr:phosphoribosylformylglycinamidine cyclo-ligase [Chloroflexota bacterium]